MESKSQRISVITGATDGIGLETAYGLASVGDCVVIVSRDENKCRLISNRIKDSTGSDSIFYYAADLSSIGQTKEVCHRIKYDFQNIDVLVNNVGAVFMKRGVNKEGVERTFALNHLSYFIFANELIECLESNGGARVVNVSSGMHFKGKIDFSDLQFKSGYRGFQAYSNSKLMNVLFSKKLSRLSSGSGIMSNALHPGFVATRFGHNHNIFFRLIMKLAQSVGAIDPKSGAETTLYLSNDSSLSASSGDYYYLSKPMASHKISYDSTAQDRLWDISTEIVYGKN